MAAEDNESSRSGLDFWLLGHASLLIQTQDMILYCDPVLWDPHHDGLFDVYPPRNIVHDLLPTATHVFVSHQHFDHFDLRSLAWFRRDVTMIVPRDKLIIDALHQLGFTRIEVIEDWSAIEVGATRLVFTPSEYKVPEHGILVQSGAIRLWNQVDSVVSPETIGRVLEEHGEIDILVAPWQPLLESVVQYNRPIAFPRSRYVDNLIRAARVAAQTTVPGACGFRFVGRGAWQNRLSFPVTRERFIRDLEELFTGPSQQTVCLEPGDGLRACGETGRVSKNMQHPAVVRNGNWVTEELAFQPGLPSEIPVGGDVSGEPGAEDLVERAAAHFSDAFATRWETFSRSFKLQYSLWNIVFQIDIYTGSFSRSWSIGFSEDGYHFRPGADPLANMHSSIDAAALEGLLACLTSWDAVVISGAYRHHHSVFSLTPEGISVPKGEALTDPIWLAAPHKDVLASRMRRELDRWAGATSLQAIRHE